MRVEIEHGKCGDLSRTVITSNGIEARALQVNDQVKITVSGIGSVRKIKKLCRDIHLQMQMNTENHTGR